VSVPHGTRTLLIGCGRDKQFNGILRVMHEVSRSPGSHLLLRWSRPEDLSRRRVLERVLISGHGSPTEAGFELSTERELRPADLRLPSGAGLYLIGCYQGRNEQRLAWAAGTGLKDSRIRGCTGETESALSTCLLLHLLEDGPDSIDRWFPLWRRCNDAFRPHFPLIREVYSQKAGDPLAALDQLKTEGILDAPFRKFEEFLGIIGRRPTYLTNLN
jgi:hypothetical protein